MSIDYTTKFANPERVTLVWKDRAFWEVKDQKGEQVLRVFQIELSQTGTAMPTCVLHRQYLTEDHKEMISYQQECFVIGIEVLS